MSSSLLSWKKSVCLTTQSLIGITSFEKYAADTSLTILYNLVGLALVEIDESKFFQRKYHRDVPGPGRWVLGMVQRNSRQCCLVQVPDRRAATLLPIIRQHVLPGTRIVTDMWAAYNQLQNHQAVNHSIYFGDPNDPIVHTNTIEGVWGSRKNKFRNMHGTSAAHFDSYLQEWLFRRLHEDNVFGNLVFWMRHYYPV